VPELRDAAGCECRLVAPGAAECGCRLPPCYQPAKALAALTKPFRAGVQCMACAGAASCSWLRMQACCTWCGCMRMQAAAMHWPAKALAALTKPFRAGVQCRACAGAARCSSGLLHLAQPAADAGCCRAPDSVGACCTNEALQGWCAVQRQVPELRDAAGCGCRLAAPGTAGCGCRLAAPGAAACGCRLPP